MSHTASSSRYKSMTYRRCGRSGLKLPAVSLGLWHNFGSVDSRSTARDLIVRAFDLGVTHFDLANNYGPPPGSAEETFGRIINECLASHRDELIISTKAGHPMWEGPYGKGGSKKHLMASLDQSLERMGLDYVDIFYHHCPDSETPIEESMQALDAIVRSGKALYVGVSKYSAEQTKTAVKILKDLGTPCLVHQVRYNMLERNAEDGLLDEVGDSGVGCIAFSPLAQGILSSKYLRGIPNNSRAAKVHGTLKAEHVTEAVLKRIGALNVMAHQRRQQLTQLALAWLLRDKRVTSVLVGASLPQQLEENVAALTNLELSDKELSAIHTILQH